MTKDFHEVVLDQTDDTKVMDRLKIRELLEYERYTRDNGYFDQEGACYSDDATIHVSWFSGAAKEYIAKTKAAGGGGSKHKMNSTMNRLIGDKAIAEMTVTMLSPRQAIDGNEFDLVSYVRIFSELQKINGQWKIVYGDCIYERDSLVPTLPGSNLKLDNAKINQYRESYKCLCYVLSRSGQKADQGQPGDDQPETVEKLYAEASEWFFN